MSPATIGVIGGSASSSAVGTSTRGASSGEDVVSLAPVTSSSRTSHEQRRRRPNSRVRGLLLHETRSSSLHRRPLNGTGGGAHVSAVVFIRGSLNRGRFRFSEHDDRSLCVSQTVQVSTGKNEEERTSGKFVDQPTGTRVIRSADKIPITVKPTQRSNG